MNNQYLSFARQTIADFTDEIINESFGSGYLFTREHYGSMYKTRSLRIVLDKDFSLTSENRRIINKVNGLELIVHHLPLENYDWHIHKLGKDYYETKFGRDVFTANKIKELLTTQSNFNRLFEYRYNDELVGYTICFENDNLVQYAYPFYDLTKFANNFGMGMMLTAIKYALENNKQNIYIGSVSKPADTYKLQFNQLQWHDGNKWQTDISLLKTLISNK